MHPSGLVVAPRLLARTHGTGDVTFVTISTRATGLPRASQSGFQQIYGLAPDVSFFSGLKKQKKNNDPPRGLRYGLRSTYHVLMRGVSQARARGGGVYQVKEKGNMDTSGIKGFLEYGIWKACGKSRATRKKRHAMQSAQNSLCPIRDETLSNIEHYHSTTQHKIMGTRTDAKKRP